MNNPQHHQTNPPGLTSLGTDASQSWLGWGIMHVFLLPLSTVHLLLFPGASACGCRGPRSPSTNSALWGQRREFLHGTSAHMCLPLPPLAVGRMVGELFFLGSQKLA